MTDVHLFDPGPAVSPLPRTGARASDFETWWAMYPLKVGKRAAHNKWVTLATKGELPDLNDLLEAVNRYKQSDKVKQGFICHPATWLHQGRWADELEVPDQSKVAPACETCGVLLGGLTMCPLLDRACPQGLPS